MTFFASKSMENLEKGLEYAFYTGYLLVPAKVSIIFLYPFRFRPGTPAL